MKILSINFIALVLIGFTVPAFADATPPNGTVVLQDAAGKVAKVPAAAQSKVTVSSASKKSEEEESYAGVIIKHSINLGFLLLTLLLSGLVKVLLSKVGFDAKNDRVQDVVRKSTAFAEQWAVKKAKVDGKAKPGGPEKLEKAIEFALELASEHKLPQKGKEWWEDQLESWLGVATLKKLKG